MCALLDGACAVVPGCRDSVHCQDAMAALPGYKPWDGAPTRSGLTTGVGCWCSPGQSAQIEGDKDPGIHPCTCCAIAQQLRSPGAVWGRDIPQLPCRYLGPCAHVSPASEDEHMPGSTYSVLRSVALLRFSRSEPTDGCNRHALCIAHQSLACTTNVRCTTGQQRPAYLPCFCALIALSWHVEV
jgi:hypothetical protein